MRRLRIRVVQKLLLSNRLGCAASRRGLANSGCTLKEQDASLYGPNVLRLLYKKIDAVPAKEYQPQNLSNALWAIATMHQDEDDYLPIETIRKLESHVCERMDDFIPQGVSNSLWALGSLNKNKAGWFKMKLVDR